MTRVQKLLLVSVLSFAAALLYRARDTGERAGVGSGSSLTHAAIPAVPAAQPALSEPSLGLAGEWEYVEGELRFACSGSLKTASLAGKRFRLQKSAGVMRFSDGSCDYEVSGDERRVERDDGMCPPKQGQAATMRILKHTIASADGKVGSVNVSAEATVVAARGTEPIACKIRGEGRVQKVGS